jgi:phenylpropionate dioxygenase-like ring-hydroxylating dioxygenase large terminal subunit
MGADCVGVGEKMNQGNEVFKNLFSIVLFGFVMEPRFCFFMDEDEKHADFFVPCIAVEDEDGYRKGVWWAWSDNFDECVSIAEKNNQLMGINKNESIRIVQSTMQTVIQ